MKKTVRNFSAVIAATLFSATCWAQSYPSQPGRILVPFSAGGAADSIARIVSDGLSQELGQTFVVENRPGASGTLAATAVARSAPDGYTLGLASFGTQVVSPLLMKLSYDPEQDLLPVINVATFANVILANPSVPVNNFHELEALIKANPGKIRFASSGVGANNHIFCETMLASISGDMLHIPYKGSTPALVDLMGGEFETMCDVSLALQYVRADKLKLLAVGSEARLPDFPDVPTMRELGYPDGNFSAWYGIVVPAGTPQDVIEKLNIAINKTLKTDRVTEALKALDAQAIGGSSQEFHNTIDTNRNSVKQIIQSRNIRIDQ